MTDPNERIADFLDRHHVLSLATAGTAGAHAANVFYGRDGFSLFWVSDPDSRHSRDIEENGRVAATVAPDTADFTAVRGVQMHGTARRVVDPARRSRLLTLLAARFRFLQRMAAAPPALRAAWLRVDVYELEPSDVVFTDNTRGFGHKDTLRF